MSWQGGNNQKYPWGWLIAVFIVYVFQGLFLGFALDGVRIITSPSFSSIMLFARDAREASVIPVISEVSMMAKIPVVALTISWGLIWGSPWVSRLALVSIGFSIVALVSSVALTSKLSVFSTISSPIINLIASRMMLLSTLTVVAILNLFCAGLWLHTGKKLRTSFTKFQTFKFLAIISTLGWIVGILIELIFN